MNNDDIRSQLKHYNHLFKKYNELFRVTSKKFNITENVLFILYFLRDNENYTQKDLCDILFQPKQSVNSILKKLESDGYVMLAFAQNSRKNKNIYLTEKGYELAKQTSDKIAEAEISAFGMLSSRERHDFINIFEHYISLLKTEIDNID